MPRPTINARLTSALDFARACVWDSVVPRNEVISSKIYWRDHGLTLLSLAPARRI